jgi:hypothetical protein
MPFQKVEFSFPHEEETSTDIEIEGSSAIEIDLSGNPQTKPEREPVVEEAVEDDLEVEVVDDTPKADRNRKPAEPPAEVTDEELAEYSDKVQNRIRQIRHFSKGYHDERRAKEAALRERQELERVAQQLVDENKRLKSTVDKNQEALLEQAKRTAAGEAIIAKRQYKQAYEAGDPDKLLEAQEKLTNAKIKADRLANLRPEALQFQETPAPIVDERANDWASSNTWFGQDDEMTSFALGLHNKLVKEGINPQTEEYYEKIDSRMRQIFPDQFEDVGEIEAQKPKRQSNVVAPATRSTAPKKIRLTQTQVAVAKRLGLTPEQYAKQVAIDMRKQ